MNRLYLLALIPLPFGGLASGLQRRQEEAESVQLQVPSSAPEGRQIVDSSFQSYSIEFSYMLDFAGNER